MKSLPAMGTNLRGDVSLPTIPTIQLHPPNISMLHISELDDLFFWSSLHFELEIGHLGSDNFFFGLHFIALHYGGQNLGNRAGVSN